MNTHSGDYIPHQVCPRCSLNLNQDLCVCGWRRPRPDLQQNRQSRDWHFKLVGTLVVGCALWWLLTRVMAN